ncbi:MAG: helix-turn-helix domain-containing protein [Methanomassiliicoccales archaeon]
MKSEIRQRGLQDEIINMRLLGKTYQEIADQFGLSVSQVGRFLKRQTRFSIFPQVSQLKKEISREFADSELKKQLSEYETLFNNALTNNNEKMAYRWAALRLECLKLIYKVYSGAEGPSTIKVIFEQVKADEKNINNASSTS